MMQTDCGPCPDIRWGPPSPLAIIAPQLCFLGVRLIETAATLPLAIAESVFAAARPLHCRGDQCREGWCDECGHCVHKCSCSHKGHRGHKGHKGYRHGTADIRIAARADDVRHKVILVQNNGPKPVTVTMAADPWTDCSGKAMSTNATTITFTPATLTLAPCEALECTAQIKVSAPMSAGETYFTHIHLQGTSANPILVDLCVEPQNRIDYCAQTDPCRRRHDNYVDVHTSDCCCDDPCCGSCHPSYDRCRPETVCCDPWYWQCDPWNWTGPDPRRLWYGQGHWDRFWVAKGMPCC